MFGLFGSDDSEGFIPEEDLTDSELEEFDFWGTLKPYDRQEFFRADSEFFVVLYIDGGTVVDARCSCSEFQKPGTGEDLTEEKACSHVKEATRIILHQYEVNVIQTDDKDELPIPSDFETVLEMLD
ncbi:hypothetical protein [Halosimplex halobium]|uniref:hypothetical protein n=1 Tax=Halosimplex halobium TaxID=3396618 RepID=UPI003F568060